MLEKLVLMSTCFFWVATELRFLCEKDMGDNEIITKDHGEMWHAQGAYMAALFLPREWPLVTHLITSYDKYYLSTRKFEEMKEPSESSRCSKVKKAKIMFKKQKDPTKVDTRNTDVLKKSRSFKVFDLNSDSSISILAKNLHLNLSKYNFLSYRHQS